VNIVRQLEILDLLIWDQSRMLRALVRRRDELAAELAQQQADGAAETLKFSRSVAA